MTVLSNQAGRGRLRVVPASETATARVCRHWIGTEERYCQATGGIRLFLQGPRCSVHTPAAVAGHPEPDAPRSRPALSVVETSTEGTAA